MATPSLAFETVDVFADEKFAGNPLAIVFLPDDVSVTQKRKHEITKEFNLSETAFVHPRNGLEWQIDIFTPGAELPFAGHPTIGSAWWLGQAHPDLEVLTLKTKAGAIPITFDPEKEGHGRKATASIPHDVRVHQAQLQADDLLAMQPALAHTVLSHAPWPVVSIVNGMTFALIRLESVEQLSKVAPASQQTPKDCLSLDAGWASTFVGSYFYVLRESETDTTEPIRISCRMIEGLLEDPATGSAACALASYLALDRGTGKIDASTTTFELEQGVQMGRSSSITVSVTTMGGRVQNVSLSGGAIKMISGHIDL